MDENNVNQSIDDATSKTVFRRFRTTQQALKLRVRVKIPLLPTSLCWKIDPIGDQYPLAGKIAISVPISISPWIELVRLIDTFI